jgi:hypothetical protein
MRHIVVPEPLSQNGLFDTEMFGWWHTQLAPEAFLRLSAGMEGVFRTSILKLMPAGELGESFHAFLGRPTKELHAMCGLLLLGEYRNWTVEQTANAWCFDASVQFALNLPRDNQSISERTVDNYRQLLRENEMAQDIFEKVTGEIIREMGLVIKKQRLDSTHIFSDMARFGRLKLLAVTVKRFLTQLKRHALQSYEALPEELRERYAASESRLFGMGSKGTRPYEESIQEVARDIAELISRFEDDESMGSRPSFHALTRVFSEHCEVTETEIAVVLAKAEDEKGQSARVMQNPSDLDAGYDGHKGPGYQVQISQAYDTGEEGAGIITACVPQSAAESDSGSLPPVQEQQKRMGTLPEIQLADTAYGSQSNVEMSANIGVELISPAGGKAEKIVIETTPQGERQTCAEATKSALDKRRAEQETQEWKKEYAKRSGLEGVHEALDRITGIKNLKVRGMKAVSMAVLMKVTGWNICAAAKIALARRKKAKKEAGNQKNTGHAPWIRRSPAGLCGRRPSRLLPPRFLRGQSEKIAGGRPGYRKSKIIFAPASSKAVCIISRRIDRRRNSCRFIWKTSTASCRRGRSFWCPCWAASRWENRCGWSSAKQRRIFSPGRGKRFGICD